MVRLSLEPPRSRYDDDLSSLGVKKMTAKVKTLPKHRITDPIAANNNRNPQRMSDEDWMSTTSSIASSKIGYYGSPQRYDPTPSVQLAADRNDDTTRSTSRSSYHSGDTRDDNTSYTSSSYYTPAKDAPSFIRDESEQSEWSAATSVSLSERMEAYKKTAKAAPARKSYISDGSTISDLTGIRSGGPVVHHYKHGAPSITSDLSHDPPGKRKVTTPSGRVRAIVQDTEKVKLDVTNNVKEETKTDGEWNMMSPLNDAIEQVQSAAKKQDLGLVSKVELFHDLKDSGYDKVKDIFQHIGDGASQKTNLVGRCVIAQAGSSESAPTMPYLVNGRGGIVSRFVESFSTGNVSTTYDVDNADHLDNLSSASSTSSHGSYEGKTTADVGALSIASIGREESGSSAMPTKRPRGIMVTAESVTSQKSVRFSDTVETKEIKEPEAPQLPSLMDDEPGDDVSVASVAESTNNSKKKGIFKSWMKGKRGRKSKSKRSNNSTFQPSLEPMTEEEELEAYGDDSSSRGIDPSTTSPAPESKKKINECADGEGIELIAGCTKSGKKAIMIARAKEETKQNQPKEAASKQPVCRDPPGSIESRQAAAFVAASSLDKGTMSEDSTFDYDDHEDDEDYDDEDEAKLFRVGGHRTGARSAYSGTSFSKNGNSNALNWFFSGIDSGAAADSSKSRRSKQWKEIAEATEMLTTQYDKQEETKQVLRSKEEEEISSALLVIRKHANRLGVSERKLMEAVQRGDGGLAVEKAEPFTRSASGRSTGSYHTSDFTTDSSHFRREHPVATKLIDMFDYYFASSVVDDTASFQSASL